MLYIFELCMNYNRYLLIFKLILLFYLLLIDQTPYQHYILKILKNHKILNRILYRIVDTV